MGRKWGLPLPVSTTLPKRTPHLRSGRAGARRLGDIGTQPEIAETSMAETIQEDVLVFQVAVQEARSVQCLQTEHRAGDVELHRSGA
eukprot:5144887-Prymnesium_polylepis.2